MSDHKTNKSIPALRIADPHEADSFYEKYYNQPFYIDKTLLIKELFKKYHVLIAAPSRFGKSLNMNMMRRFVEIEVDKEGSPIELDVDEDNRCLKEVQPTSRNFKMFQGKNIFKEKEIMFEHFGKYPTIYVDFSEMTGENFKQVVDALKQVINRAFRKHRYLQHNPWWDYSNCNKKTFMKYYDTEECMSLSLVEIKAGLRILSEILHDYYNREVFVFIDEFDVPVNSMVYDNDVKPRHRKQTIKLIQDIRNLLKGNEYVARSLSNACHQLSGILSRSANNVTICPFLQNHLFTKFYGFEETEVKNLLEKVGLIEGFNNIKATYNGYKTNDSHNIDIYSPWAISKYICNKTLGVYWSAEIPPGIEEGIAHFKIRPKIAKIMSGESVRIKYIPKLHFKDVQRLSEVVCRSDMKDNDVDLFLQFLYELGFFHPTECGGNYLYLALPNKAVYRIIHPVLNRHDMIKKYYNHSPKLIRNFIESLKNMARSCNENSARRLAKSIDVLFKKGRRTPSSEYEFHYVLYGYMLQEFGSVTCETIASNRNRCDTLVWIEELHAVAVFSGSLYQQ
ncbi:hypothetical protein PV328_002471 [Microctonus aethiopoides]|uniref:AAA-ATPase-like domain-containing protein n=1 Tax=Microctonus aethiopoides TaxID=144406 RepID=A0AA39F6F1_9HYME|nr:hypothetical protein PV328_002471 [Microctonus aethiopoides]